MHCQPLPTHQSQSVESPSGKWIPSSTLGVQLTDRGARTEMSQPGLARPEQLLSCSRTSGRPRRSGQEPNFSSSTPMWSQSCSTDAKLRERTVNEYGDVISNVPIYSFHLHSSFHLSFWCACVRACASSPRVSICTSVDVRNESWQAALNVSLKFFISATGKTVSPSSSTSLR